MYTTVIGTRFLGAKDPLDFLRHRVWPDIFGGEKLALNAGNTPMDTLIKLNRGYKKADAATRQRMRLDTLDQIVKKAYNDPPNMSSGMGFPCRGLDETTSGQAGTMKITPHDVLASWVGACLGVMVSGGVVIFFDNPVINAIIASGWKLYRHYLDTTPAPPYKLHAWNGRFLFHALTHIGNPPFNPFDADYEIATVPWTNLFFVAFPARQTEVTVYAASFGQQNTTYGFVQVDLTAFRRVTETYARHLVEYGGAGDGAIWDVYNPEMDFRKVCEEGIVGLTEIRPKDHKLNLPYIMWVIAMLNKDLREFAMKSAREFVDYETRNKRHKTDRKQGVKRVLAARNKFFLTRELKPLLEDIVSFPFIVEFERVTMNEIQDAKYHLFRDLLNFHYKTEKELL